MWDTKQLCEFAAKRTEHDAALTIQDLKTHLNEQKRKKAADKGLDVNSTTPVGRATLWRWKQVAEDSQQFKRIHRAVEKPSRD